MSDLTSRIHQFIKDLSTDEVEERVAEYVIREVRDGRSLNEVLHDPYVKNRLSEDKLVHVLENPHVIDAIEESIAESFKGTGLQPE